MNTQKLLAAIGCFVLILAAKVCNAQIADAYPHDVGIETDPDVLFVEQFDDPLSDIFSRYDDLKNTAGMSLDPDVPPGSTGPFSLKMTNLGGVNSGGHLFKSFLPGWDSAVYLRYYVKYPAVSQGYIHHESVWLGGYNPVIPYPFPHAGTCGLGDSRISVAYEPVSAANMNTYLYWGDMHNDPNGNCWGNVMIKGDSMPLPVPYDQWMCVEIMVKLNDPATAFNGELEIWHDGIEVGHWGPGFPNGSWTWDKFIVDPGSPPFEGFRWRTDPDLNLNYLWIEYYDDQSPANVSHHIQFDHLVVAKRRIGPIFAPSGLATPAAEPAMILSPNPVSHTLSLRLPGATVHAEISCFDLLGKRVLSLVSTGEETGIDVSGLASGVYFLQVRAGDKTRCQKFIKSAFLGSK